MRPARLLAPLATLLLSACDTAAPAVVPPDMAVSLCTSNNDCAASTTGHVCAKGACVVCAVDTDCAAGKKCDSGKACVECRAAGDCAQGQKCVAQSCAVGCDDKNPCPTGKVCNLGAGACVECNSAKDCKDPTPNCDPTTHACVGCVADGDCGAGRLCRMAACVTGCSGAHPECPAGQVCNVSGGACVGCLSDGDCKTAEASRCEVKTNTCVACLPSGDNCPAGQYCAGTSCAAGCRANGDCASMMGTPQCDTTAHACVECVDDAACPLGKVCKSQKCADGCSPQHACPGGQGCCSNACFALSTDDKNCGACGKACADGEGCCGGVCTSLSTVASCGACGKACAFGQDCCTGACQTLATDAKNCGACGKACGASETCCGGGCSNLATDAKNCGACGKACAAGQDCCGKGCVDLQKDAMNCGACGKACGAGESCCGGACVNLKTDAKNCGACGTSCGTGGCYDGACALASCAEILKAKPGSPSGKYLIDPDGPTGVGKSFQVYCDMVLDGGGWTRFNWITSSFPSGQDPLGQDLSECSVDAPTCFGRIPTVVTPKDWLIRDTTDNQYAMWHFDGSTISNAVLGALRDKKAACTSQQSAWQPYVSNVGESYCGNGCEGGCDSFFYGNANCAGIGGWGIELDGDTGWACAAVKLGASNGTNPDWAYLNYYTTRDEVGEMYYR